MDGTESAWAYTHLPRGLRLESRQLDAHVERIEAEVLSVLVDGAAPVLGIGQAVAASHRA